MPHPSSSPTVDEEDDGVTLRVVWPQWQGGGTTSVETFASEFPLDVARRGYAVGSIVLDAVLPPHDGPTAAVPVTMSTSALRSATVWKPGQSAFSAGSRPGAHRPA